mmetsp:Transcript_29751/g.83126  ORF Transcript_29751/g.83126 Transcript_29751/m.83126 type:complete len:228 (-) Transcript_29751:41-724(-)
MAAGEEAGVQVFRGEWDDEGVYVYQAFNERIAEWAVKHQRFGGPDFLRDRMTWIKPSFAWVLYRSGYGSKHNQNRVLKVKVPHDVLAALLERCACRVGGGGTKGRVQWDPERDLYSADGKVPRRMIRQRAIQIGIKQELSHQYVDSTLSIQDVTPLAHAVQSAHRSKDPAAALAALSLPNERPYLPHCSLDTLRRLGMSPGESASNIARTGLGKAELSTGTSGEPAN